MRVFQFSAVSNEHQDLLLDDRMFKTDEERMRLIDFFRFDGTPKGSEWTAPLFISLNPRQPIPDIWSVKGTSSGAFAVNEYARDRLLPFLEMAGELLPLNYKDLGLSLCNITECVDCIDEQASSWRKLPSGRRLLEKPVFRADYLPESTLFKIPQRPRNIYCWERTGEAEDEFKACVELNKFKGGFKGNFFELVWESNDE